MTDAASKLRWDIFCKVVDNFGDIGICWRLAQQLQIEHGLQVKLWVDDLDSAQKIIPFLNTQLNQQVIDNISIKKWYADADFNPAADVVIEAFACDLPLAYLAAMTLKQSKWINLEYLSAEAWVDDFHAKPSPKSEYKLVRHFYFPGFTEKTGGLIREAHLARQFAINPRAQSVEGARQRGRGAEHVNFNAAALSNLSDGTTKHLTRLTNDISQVIANPTSGREAKVNGALKISLFSYPFAPIHDVLNALQANSHEVHVYAPQSSILPNIAQFFGKKSVQVGDKLYQNNLTVEILPFLSQADYDALLAKCDLNFVRGEDSWIRAIWAGKPFIWQPYIQDENAHMKKLDAFLNLFYANYEQKQLVCEAHKYWSAGQLPKAVLNDYLNDLDAIRTHTKLQSAALAKQPDLAAKLVAFCSNLTI